MPRFKNKLALSLPKFFLQLLLKIHFKTFTQIPHSLWFIDTSNLIPKFPKKITRKVDKTIMLSIYYSLYHDKNLTVYEIISLQNIIMSKKRMFTYTYPVFFSICARVLSASYGFMCPNTRRVYRQQSACIIIKECTLLLTRLINRKSSHNNMYIKLFNFQSNQPLIRSNRPQVKTASQ
jgi:hypothetical protein